ncbi:hypothetical protein BD410DRAFT_785426 [Rickenella mellea]|uniref:Uncharacterized protein n=1 Tax=Rickenella mellea TaxID=50990 RepID=A0A4Y7QAN9_9AGAM|nr:hypothetical protein BD410DRAFT_785426 [Rickenella mellea]
MSPMGNALPLLNPELLSQRAPWANPTAQLVTIHAGQGPPDRTASRASYRAPSVAPEYVSSRTPKPYEKGHSTQHDGNTRSQTVPQGRNESSAQAAYAAQSKPVPNLFAHAVPDKALTDKQEHSKRMSTFLSPPSFNPPEITPTHSSSSSVPTERFQSTAASPPPILTNEQQSLWGSKSNRLRPLLLMATSRPKSLKIHLLKIPYRQHRFLNHHILLLEYRVPLQQLPNNKHIAVPLTTIPLGMKLRPPISKIMKDTRNRRHTSMHRYLRIPLIDLHHFPNKFMHHNLYQHISLHPINPTVINKHRVSAK